MKGVIFINTSPDKDPSGSTEKRGEEEEERGEVEGGCWVGAAFGINVRPLIVCPITSI